jgi:prepilin-type N-terminal cleavage/methylation domain-containing protein
MNRRGPAGYTLLEAMIVIAIIAILVAVLMPRANSDLCDQLVSTAQTVLSDMEYGRSLAVANNDSYQFTFNLTNNSYVLQYAGTVPALKTLPRTPYSNPSEGPTTQTTTLGTLTGMAVPVTLAAVGSSSTTSSGPTTTLTFGPLGQITQGQDMMIWLAAGTNSWQRYLPLYVNHVTGLTTVGTYSGIGPPASLLGH